MPRSDWTTRGPLIPIGRTLAKLTGRHPRGSKALTAGLLIGISLVVGWQAFEETARPASKHAADHARQAARPVPGRGITVALLSPPKRGVTVKGVVTFRAKARFAKGLARVVFVIDKRRIGVDRRAPYIARWDSRKFPNGQRRVRVTAFTKAGGYASRRYFVTVANPRDTQEPSTPTGLAVTGVTGSGFQVSWSPSADNVGVTGYRVLHNGALVNTPIGPSHTFGSLPCGSTHVIAVEATDAAGNRSAPATISASTRGCGRTPPPPASVFVAPNGSDAAPCTQAAPCATMNRAYHVANTAAGPIGIQMAGGNYPGQTFSPDPSKTTDNDVVFFPAPGASVNVTGEVRAVEVAHMTISNITLEDWYLLGADDVTFQDVDTIAGYVNGSSRVRVLGGDYGPHRVAGATHVALLHIRGGVVGGGFKRSRDVLVDGAYLHDHTRGPGEHAEAMQIWSADDVTISNSKFKTCAVYCIFVANLTDPIPSRNVLIENNWFAPGGDTAGSQGAISYWAFGLTIRNNSFVGGGAGPNDPVGYPSQNVAVTGNLGFQGPCNNRSWNVYAYNVWDGRSCSATDKNAPPGFVDPANFDLHIKAGSAAIDSGSPTSFPGVDIDGEARPLGPRSDAGADERS